MTWKPPTDQFTIEKPKAEVFAPSGGWGAQAAVVAPWVTAAPQEAPETVEQPYQSDEGLKKLFGIELAKAANAFEAACKLFNETETQKALWVSYHWIADPVVIAARDVYLKTVTDNAKPLDREQLAAKVLALSEEKIFSQKHGSYVPTIDAKDRIAALKLYSDILGYTGKVEIDNSITNNTLNELTIKLVKPEQSKPSIVIDNAPNKNAQSEIINEPSPISLKLVKAG
jgi:hypothetical protein